MSENIVIKVANIQDIAGILRLQSENQVSNGGTLSAALTADQISEMMSDMPQIVAIIEDEVVGFLLTTSKKVHQKRTVAIVDAMFESYSGNAESYIYGPICVSEKQRGKRLAQLMFAELLVQEPAREGILFIKDDNEASLKAHEKMGIEKVSTFTFNHSNFSVFAYLFP